MNKFYTVFKYYFLLLLLFAFSADILGQATYKLIKSTSKLVADTKNIFSKAVVMAFFILAFSANSFGVDVTHTFSSTNGSIDANINFTTQQNSSANAPAFSGNLRLYYNSGGDGCSITLTPSNGAVITAVELYAVSSYTPTVKYNVDGGTDATASLSSTTYTISSISASSSLKIRNANTSNTQLRLTGIKVTYTPKYTVTYNGNGSNGGTVPSDASSPYATGSTVTVLGPGTMTKTGNTFAGWDSDNNGSADFTGSGSETFTITANTTLKAVWTPSSSPSLSATALTNFGTQCEGGTYGPNMFTITGANLTTVDVTVAALSGFTYSTTSGGTYNTSLSLSQSSGAYSQDIYVKFSPTSGSSYNGNIVVGGGGASNINIAASGIGLAKATPSVSIASTPAAVSGTTTVCSGTNVSFTATASALGGGTASYQWKLNGTNVGTNSNSYSNNTLTTGNTISCDITVSGGCVAATTASSNTITMAVNPSPSNDLCSNAVSLTANAAAVSGTMTPCAGFESPFSGSKKDVWYKFVAPCNADYTITLTGFSGDMDMSLFYNSNSCPSSTTSLSSSTTSTPTETITYTLTSGNTYYIRVYAFNTAAESSPFTIGVTGITTVPAQPDPIAGETSVCPGIEEVYSTNTVANATGYTWAVPTGWTITAGAGTTSITVTTGSSGGTVSVTADNGCGSSTVRNVAVSTLTVPTAPTATAGTAITGASFTANWNSVGGITDYSVDVYTYNTNQNIAAWTFPTSGTITTADIYNANNNGKTITRQGGGSITDIIGATTRAAYGDGGWNSGSGSKFWQILIDASDSKNLTLSSKQQSSNSGPRDWKVQYKIGSGGTWTDITGGNITVANNFTTGVLTNLALPSACDFQSELYIRWIMTSNTQSDGGGSVASGGTSRIDDIYVNGDMFSYVPGYENIITSGTSLAVTGLSPNTDYYYVVRADNGNCVSPNSNTIKVTTSSCASATHTVTSILPNTGPVGTRVLIRGTGFTSITDVQIGGISITDYTVVDNTTIIARIPDGATTSTIDVYNNGCPKPSGNFTVLSSVGLCGGGASVTPTDLLISEVYDSETGSRGYIELYNGTASTINLSNYKIKIYTGATTWVSLSGTLAPNKFAIVKIGSTGTDCDAVIAATNALVIDRSASSGYNENDPIELYKGNTKIDRMVTPNEKGFNMERNTLTDAPSTTFTSANWTKTSTETCSSLGNPSFNVAPLLVINTNATDWTTCPGTVQFTVSAIATPAPVTSYTWYYNDFNLMTGWQLVSGNITGATGTNTATLILPADFAPLYNYQFYCDINKTNSGNSCTKATNAAYFTYPTARYYRTKTTTSNGSWTTPSEWEMSTDINFVNPAPITACAYPLSVNSSAAFVQNGTKTTIGDGISSYVIDIDKITIDGTLELHKKSSLFVYDSTASGADMIVNGTLIDRAGSSDGIYFTGTSANNGSGWTLGNTATVIKTNGSSAVVYKDWYQDGISTIPDGSAGAKWIYRYIGDGNPSTNAVGMFYPNLAFENTGSATNFPFNNSLMALTGASGGYCTVKGNMDIGTSGIGTVTVYNNNINSQAMKVLGNMTIGNGSTFTNTSYDGVTNATRGHGTGIELYGNLTNDGTFTNNSNSIGILRFKGTGTQTVSGAGTFNLYNVELDKPSQTLVDQQVNLTAQNNLNFNAGGILKTNANVFSVNNGSIANAVTGHETAYTGAATPNYSNDKYVFGKLERVVNTNGIYDFPVGDDVAGEGYNPIRFERISGTGNATAWFIPGDPGIINTGGPIGVSCTGRNFYHYTDMTGEGKWRMESGTSTNFNYNVYLHPNQNNANNHPNDDGTNYPYFYKNNYRALKAPNGTNDWTPYAGLVDPCVVGSYYNTPGADYTGFSDFAIPGGDGLSTALPVELTSFTATCNDNNAVDIRWTTASELNSSAFMVQRSVDGIHFSTIATLAAAGNSSIPRHYVVIDSNAVTSNNYYRLIEVALDGQQTIYSFLQVRCAEVNGMNVYYNQPKVVVEVSATKDKEVNFQVFEISGKLLHQETKILTRGYNKFDLSIQNRLANGIYIIQMHDEDRQSSMKIMIH